MLDERNYPNYHPRFDIRRALAFKVESAGQGLEAAPELPAELVDAASVLAGELLAGADSLLDRVDEVLGELKACLGGKSFAGMSVNDYEEAVAAGDVVAADAFEDFHLADPAGRTQAELYCLLCSLRARVEHVRSFVERHLLPVSADTPGRLIEAEEKMYTDLAYLEYTQPGSADRLALAYEAQLKHQVHRRLEYLMAAVEEGVATAGLSLADTCYGRAEEMGGVMAAAEKDVLAALKTVLETAFASLAAWALDLKEHDRLYGGEEIIRQLAASAVSLRELRLNAGRKVTGWLKSLDLGSEESPAYALANCALEGLTSIDSGLDRTILDLSKAQAAERMNLEERLLNMRQRKQARQLISLVDALLTTVNFDLPAEERRRQGAAVAAVYAAPAGICAL